MMQRSAFVLLVGCIGLGGYALYAWIGRVPDDKDPSIPSRVEVETLVTSRTAKTASPRPMRAEATRESIDVSPEPKSPIQSTSKRSLDPRAVVPVPKRFKGDLDLFASLARREGVKIPADLKLPTETWNELNRKMRAFGKELEEIEKVRMPIVERIADAKRWRGESTVLKRPSAEASKSDKTQYRKAMRTARKQTERDQTIVRGGAGDEMWFVRVNPSDDARLAAIYDRISNGRKLAIGGLLMSIEPFLQPKKKR